LKFESEEAMATVVVAWLASDGWDVHQEVKVGDSRADIVAHRPPVLWIVECKLSLSFDLLSQLDAWRRTGLAHRLAAAVPASRGRAAAQFLPLLGLGLVEVDADRARLTIPAPLVRVRNAHRLRDRLCEETRTFARAGNADGEAWTPFMQTCRNLAEVLKPHDGRGLAVRDAMFQLKDRHHYGSDASARSSLRKWIEQRKVPGVREEMRDGSPRWYYDASTAAKRTRWR
jgi:hypothetical protein